MSVCQYVPAFSRCRRGPPPAHCVTLPLGHPRTRRLVPDSLLRPPPGCTLRGICLHASMPPPAPSRIFPSGGDSPTRTLPAGVTYLGRVNDTGIGPHVSTWDYPPGPGVRSLQLLIAHSRTIPACSLVALFVNWNFWMAEPTSGRRAVKPESSDVPDSTKRRPQRYISPRTTRRGAYVYAVCI
ncbi:hypothetical protein HYPSUDRAFT_391849 [Hypholoma sublateritium FD-334 SS-4]|uniref:Uncharacterized protein n=1 Tax=Hypholoma sublateritium (strain FD-334 SS-4) TaxID=945553 RepID=A0A0D2P462_HYPSF|nr:hypothetical protein HYPSUDRAFT_391849 [Hypholoma sublateritium FD-334 SS-4]